MVDCNQKGKESKGLRLKVREQDHDQHTKKKATPKKLTYDDSEEEGSESSKTKGLSERSSSGSSGTAGTQSKARCFRKSQMSLSRSKTSSYLRRSERLGSRSRSKAKAKKGRTKSRTRRSGHKETSSDSDYEEDLKETCEELSTPYKRPKPTPFTTKITRFKYHRRAKLPRNIKVYEGSKDSEDHLGIFSTAVEQEESRKHGQFRRVEPEILGRIFTKKRYAKDPTEIHGIKRRLNKGLQAFMDRFKSESSRIKGVRPVLRISAFMHAFIRGEAATGSAKVARAPQWDKGNVCTRWSRGQERIKGRSAPREFRRSMETYASYSRTETFTPLTKTPKEILGMESVSFPPPPPLIGTSKKKNLNKFCDYHRDRGHNTNDCYNLKKQIEETVASGKLAHLVKDIRKGNQRNRGQGRRNVKVINMVGLGGNRKRSYKTEKPRVTEEITFPPIPWNSLTDAPIILEGTIEGFWVQRIYVDGGSSSEIMPGMEPMASEGPWEEDTIKEKVVIRDDRLEKPIVTNLYNTWQVHMDFSSLNKVCPKDMYPFPKIEENEDHSSCININASYGSQGKEVRYECPWTMKTKQSSTRKRSVLFHSYAKGAEKLWSYLPTGDGQGSYRTKRKKCGSVCNNR
ncbi:hypothetical protein Tco_1102871 [Tanacetum coccineum]